MSNAFDSESRLLFYFESFIFSFLKTKKWTFENQLRQCMVYRFYFAGTEQLLMGRLVQVQTRPEPENISRTRKLI